MLGAFAHITLVNMLMETRRLDALKYFKYCELGAVRPDYPYLAIGDKDAAK